MEIMRYDVTSGRWNKKWCGGGGPVLESPVTGWVQDGRMYVFGVDRGSSSKTTSLWHVSLDEHAAGWQQIIVVAMQKAGALDRFESQYFTADNIADGIQYVCICVEMVFCSIAHIYAFTYQPYVCASYKCPITPYAVTSCCGSFASPASCFLYVINPVDLWQDFVAFVKLKSAEVLKPVAANPKPYTDSLPCNALHTPHVSGENAPVAGGRGAASIL
jgi:hypothetical protein